MVFAYAPLLGVYAAAVFTKRGSERSVKAAFVVGFVGVALLQSLQVPFSYALLLASVLAFLVAVSKK